MSIFKDPIIAGRIRKFISIRNSAINFEHRCMLPNCSEIAINSHIIQRSQFLEPIADKNGKLMSLETKEMFPGKLPRFLRISIRNILTFKGFCSYHDQLIFSEIERNLFDLSKNRHLALFCYRGICLELNKKEIIVKWLNGVVNDKEDFKYLSKKRLDQRLDLQKLGIRDLSYYKDLLEKDIIQNESNYEFLVYKLVYREIVTSVCFNIEDLLSEDPNKIYDEEWRNTPLKVIMLTIFPKDGELVLIIGFLKEHDKEVKAFIEKLGGISLDFVNKILLGWVETWACSETFYKEKIEHQRQVVQEVSARMNTEELLDTLRIPNLMN